MVNPDTIQFNKQSNGNYTLTVKCPFCGKETQVKDVSPEGWFSLMRGALMQVAFPNMPIEDREVLISGLCRDCQEEVFGSQKKSRRKKATANA